MDGRGLFSLFLAGLGPIHLPFLVVLLGFGITENYIHGKWNGGKLPFGYRFDSEKRVVVDDGEAAIVAEIFRLYAETPMTTNQIKIHLREKGVVNRNGKPFTHGTLSGMLLSRKYIGEYGSEECLNTTLFPPIVDRGGFDKVQAKIKMNTRGSGRFKAKDLYLLSGKIFCGSCGSRMNGESGTARNGETKRYYKCAAAKKAGCGHGHATIKKEFVEQQVVLAVMQFFDDDLSLQQLASKVYAYEQMANPILKRLEEQFADLERKSQNIMRAIEKGFDGEDVLARYQEIREAKKRLLASLDEETGKRSMLSYDTILWALRRFRTLDVESEFDKRYLIDAFVESVIVHSKDQIDVNVNFKFWGKKISITSDQSGSDTSQYAPPNCYDNRPTGRFSFISSDGDMFTTVYKMI